MIRFHALVFDDWVPSSEPVYTGVPFMKALAAGDQIGIHAVVDGSALVAAMLRVVIEHSTDGINWAQKNTTPEIDAALLSAGTTSVYGGETYPATQSLEFVRLRIIIANNTGASAKIYATVRDRGKGEFCACDCPCDENDDDEDEDGRIERLHAEAANLAENRPEAALLELRRHLAQTPDSASPAERVKAALGAMGNGAREELEEFLGRAARVASEMEG